MKDFKFFKNYVIGIFLIFVFISCGKRNPEVFFHNCEPDWMWTGTASLKPRADAHSGNMVSVLDSTTEFSVTLNKPLNELVNGLPKTITFSAWVRYATMDAKSSLVMSIENQGKTAQWESVDVNKIIREANKWYLISKKVTIDNKIPLNHLLKIYVWNNNKQEIWVDDIKAEVQ